MPQFLISGVDDSGNRETELVNAETSKHAIRQMHEWGYRDVQLHTDDAGAYSLDLNLEEGLLTAEDVVNIAGMPLGRYFLYLLAVYYRSFWWSALLGGALIAVMAEQESVVSITGAIGVLLLTLPALLAASSAFTGSSRDYDALLEAVAWGKWERVLELTPPLRGQATDLELDAREGLALANMGRFEEGVARLKKHEQDPDTPFWIYAARLTEVYDAAGKHDESIRLLNRSLEDAGDNTTVQLDVAFALLKNRSELARARQLIETAEQQDLDDLTKLLLPGIKGLLSLNEGRPRDAIAQFNEAVQGLQPMTGNQLIPLVQDTFRAYAAIAYAEAGEIKTAHKLQAKSRPRMEAVGNRRVLSWIDEAIPQP